MNSRTATVRLNILVKNPAEKTDARIANASAMLGPKGIKAVEFFKKFDDDVLKLKYPAGTPLTVKIFANLDANGRAMSYTYKISSPSVSYLVKTQLGVEKLSDKPLHKIVATVDNEFVDKIVAVKLAQSPWMNASSIKKSIIGSLRSCGIQFKD